MVMYLADLVCVLTGVKERHTMGSPQRESGARRRETAQTAHQSLLWRHWPGRDTPPLLSPSYQTSPAWLTPPMSPVWKITANLGAPPAWQHAVVRGRVSVSAHIMHLSYIYIYKNIYKNIYIAG